MAEGQERQRDGGVSVLIVDDHRTFADLLAFALSAEPDLTCVGTANSVQEAEVLVEKLRPDIIVMDVRLGDGDGIAATAQFTARYPELRVVVLTAQKDEALLERSAEAGACCLLPKDGSLTEVLAALRTARRGGLIVHPALLQTLMASRRRDTAPVPELTTREYQVLCLLSEGMDARTIGRRLDISVHTCRGYVQHLLVKLGAHSQLEAVAIAKRHGLIDAGAPAAG